MKVRRVDLPAGQWTQLWPDGERVYGVINTDVGAAVIKEQEGTAETWGWPLAAAPVKRGEGGVLMFPPSTAETMNTAFKGYSGDGTTLVVLQP